MLEFIIKSIYYHIANNIQGLNVLFVQYYKTYFSLTVLNIILNIVFLSHEFPLGVYYVFLSLKIPMMFLSLSTGIYIFLDWNPSHISVIPIVIYFNFLFITHRQYVFESMSEEKKLHFNCFLFYQNVDHRLHISSASKHKRW